MEHFGIEIANFNNPCEAISPKTHAKPFAPRGINAGVAQGSPQGVPLSLLGREGVAGNRRVKIDYEEEIFWKIGYLLSMMRN